MICQDLTSLGNMFRKAPVQIVLQLKSNLQGEFVAKDYTSPPEQSEVPSPSWNDVEPVVPGCGILSPRYTKEKCGRLVMKKRTWRQAIIGSETNPSCGVS